MISLRNQTDRIAKWFSTSLVCHVFLCLGSNLETQGAIEILHWVTCPSGAISPDDADHGRILAERIRRGIVIAQATEPLAKLVTKPSTASGTPQPTQTHPAANSAQNRRPRARAEGRSASRCFKHRRSSSPSHQPRSPRSAPR